MKYRHRGYFKRRGYRHDDDYDDDDDDDDDDDYDDDDDDDDDIEMSAPVQYCTSITQGKVSG